ncbi:hypothetical protein C8J57DRAFT_1401300 [Mycena rebaudengoi]|nr:hypothetical protein C8J57DRAFT_1401300 [Mycena rebaudengoi]
MISLSLCALSLGWPHIQDGLLRHAFVVPRLAPRCPPRHSSTDRALGAHRVLRPHESNLILPLSLHARPRCVPSRTMRSSTTLLSSRADRLAAHHGAPAPTVLLSAPRAAAASLISHCRWLRAPPLHAFVVSGLAAYYVACPPCVPAPTVLLGTP